MRRPEASMTFRLNSCSRRAVLILIWFSCSAHLFAADVVLQNNMGVKFVISQQPAGYAFGMVYVNGKLVEAPLTKGVLAFRNTADGQETWLYASKAEQVTASEAVLSGVASVGGTTVQFKVTLDVPADVKALKITYEFQAERDLSDWQAVLAYHSQFGHTWKCHMYPWTEDAKFIQREPLSYMGIPSLFLYRDDRSLGLLWGIDPNWDYLNPTTWTRDIGLYFIDGIVSPQFRVGGSSLKAGFRYEVPMQIVLTDTSDPDGMITDLMKSWVLLNHYWPEPLSVRTNDEALNLFIEGRKTTDLWIPGKGYRLESGDIHTVFIYIGEQGLNAYFDYLVYEMTGDPLWRTRAFEQMDFISKGQNASPADPNYGVVHTAYNLNDTSPGGLGFNSVDRGENEGYKPDLNAHLARYMLLTWKRVKDHEGIDRRDWYNSASLAINWVLRQQNNDGGLPQKVAIRPIEAKPENQDWIGTPLPDFVKTKVGEKSRSVASGRALPALQWIYKITSDPQYKRFLDSLEAYTLNDVQNQYYYIGHHPDLPPFELEEASIWGICEYWLNKYDETQDAKYLNHAVADAYLALTWWCPKQLSWVKNPTQGGSAEQTNFLQYSVYSYQDRKPESIKRLYEKTGNPLFEALARRVLQNIFWTQVTSGNLMGATHERIADPWLARADDNQKPDFDSLGTIYMGEQSLDAFLQIVEMYRTGRDLYFGENMTNKVYPDGIAFSSSDINGKKKANLLVLPSSGTIKVAITAWSAGEKKWIESEATSPKITTAHRVGDLEPKCWYQVLDNGRAVGIFQSDPKGAIHFAYTGTLTTLHTFEVRKGQ